MKKKAMIEENEEAESKVRGEKRKRESTASETDFDRTAEAVVDAPKVEDGIGTYMEKSVHAVLKKYYAPDEEAMEVKAEGFVADICYGDKIIEIQTKQFYRLRRKLEAYLPRYDVTIVYPVAETLYLQYVDTETGQVTNRRKSPKKGSIYDVFAELYAIRQYLKEPGLHLIITCMEIEEYRMRIPGPRKRWGKRSTPGDRIPAKLNREYRIESVQDYLMFVPVDLPEEFTVREFAKAAGIYERLAGITLSILSELGIVERIGKRGRAFVYRVCE